MKYISKWQTLIQQLCINYLRNAHECVCYSIFYLQDEIAAPDVKSEKHIMFAFFQGVRFRHFRSLLYFYHFLIFVDFFFYMNIAFSIPNLFVTNFYRKSGITLVHQEWSMT